MYKYTPRPRMVLLISNFCSPKTVFCAFVEGLTTIFVSWGDGNVNEGIWSIMADNGTDRFQGNTQYLRFTIIRLGEQKANFGDNLFDRRRYCCSMLQEYRMAAYMRRSFLGVELEKEQSLA